MKESNCWNVVNAVVMDVTDQLVMTHKLDNRLYGYLKSWCLVFDKFAEEFEGQSFSAEVMTADLSVTVSMVCPMITIYEGDHPLVSLIENIISLTFEPVDEEYLRAKFVFPSIWGEIL